MRPLLLAATVLIALVSATPTARACAPLIATDPVTGETFGSGSPEWSRREQATWRARSEVVLIAQLRAGRMLASNEIEFTLVPIVTVYGGALPESDLLFRWQPGNTCNRFALNIADFAIVYVSTDGSIVGVTVPDQLQDRPTDFPTLMRDTRRGIIPAPVRRSER